MAAKAAEAKRISAQLSAWLRTRAEAGVEPPEITVERLEQIEQDLPQHRVSEKQLLLLRALEAKSTHPGRAISLNTSLDYPLAWAENEEEIQYLLRSLAGRGLIRRTDLQSRAGLEEDVVAEFRDTWVPQVEITAAGWDALEKSERPRSLSSQVFVAMSFNPSLKPAWEAGIRPGMIDAGYNPYRVDSKPHLDRVDVKIMSDIKDSLFMVADVTGQRPGVYFEAGYALGLGLRVFWCVRKNEVKKVHFDTRQYNHIIWADEADLRAQLTPFVIAIMGRGPRVPSGS